MGEGAALDNEGYGRRGRKSGVQAWTPNLPYAGPLACGDSDAPAHCPQGAIVKHTPAPTPPSFRRLSPRETPSLSSCVSRRYGACERRAAHARHLRMGHCMPSRKNMPAHRVYDCAAEYGASPRATLALDRCARANAWLRGADFVSPDDVQAVAFDVLRHRIILSFEAEANGISADQVINDLISRVPVT